MIHARRVLTVLLFAAFSGALPAQSSHGAGYTTVTTTDSGGRKTTTSTGMEVLGAKFRTSIRSDIAPGVPVDVYTIIDSVAGTVTSVMPAQSMVMIMPRSIMQSSALPPFTIDFDGTPTVNVVDLGAGERILGLATHHYRQTVSFSMKVTIGGETCSRPRREVADVWTTSDVALPDLSGAVQRFTGATLSVPTTAFGLKLDSIRKMMVKGTMLRRVGTTTAIGPTGDTLHITTTMELTALNPDSVSAADFDVPTGYKVMDAREMMAGMDPAVLQESQFKTQLMVADKMKQLLCGAAENRKP